MEGKNISVAFCDDSVCARKGIATLLTMMGGIEIPIEADNGVELIEEIEKKGVPDLCLLDISMPKMNGFDTLRELKKRWPDLGVLVLTIHKLEYYTVRMIVNGAGGYLLKSCDPEELKRAIFSVYEQGYYYSEAATYRFVQAIKRKEVKLPNITPNEINILKYCCSDLSYAEIAEELGTTTRSVEGYRDSLFRKLNVHNRVALAMFAVQFGLVPVETVIPTTEDFLNKKIQEL